MPYLYHIPIAHVCTISPHKNDSYTIFLSIQLQDDPDKANVSSDYERSPTAFCDDSDPLQPDSTNGSQATSDFDPDDLDKHEQQDAALQAEQHACAMALRALDQLGSESNTLLEADSDGELDDTPADLSHIENIKFTQEFTEDISTATFENGCLDDDVIHHLHNPCNEPTIISDPNIRLSLDLFLAVTNASKETYHASRNAILLRYPDSGILSYHAVKRLVAQKMGVVAVYNDMCINSCHAFMGPFAQLRFCSICGEARYDVAQAALTGKDIARQQFCTILLGPQLQALQ